MNAIAPNITNLQSDSFVTPLVMYQPMNLIVLLTFYSPIIIALGVLSMSFIFQNFKGFIYLGFLLSVSVAREFLLMISGATQKVSANRVCDMAQYSKYGNTGFSIFVISFTLFYICMPMFLNKDVNWWVFGGLLFYLLMDVGIRYMKQCITQVSDILLNLVTGAAAGLLIPGLLYVGGSSKYLFFNEISSTKEICSMPKKQNFKCAVYKNGELIGSA
jgi:hypothetical protein